MLLFLENNYKQLIKISYLFSNKKLLSYPKTSKFLQFFNDFFQLFRKKMIKNQLDSYPEIPKN